MPLNPLNAVILSEQPMNPADEQTMKGYAESLEIQLTESLDNLQGERKVNALRLIKLLGWYSETLEELKVKNIHLHQEIENLKELLD